MHDDFPVRERRLIPNVIGCFGSHFTDPAHAGAAGLHDSRPFGSIRTNVHVCRRHRIAGVV